MSLDVTELVLDVEESFRVRLPNSELQRLFTVGDLYRMVLREMGCVRGGPCLSSVTFHRLRRALMEAVGATRRSVTPRSRLDQLIPVESRRLLWNRVGHASGSLRLPDLTRPGWVIAAITLAATALFGTGVYALYGRGSLAVAGLVLGTILLARFAYRVTTPLAVCFPSEYATVGDLVHHLLAFQYGQIAADAAPIAVAPRGEDREVWDALCRIISEDLGVDRNLLTETTSFSDLGVN